MAFSPPCSEELHVMTKSNSVRVRFYDDTNECWNFPHPVQKILEVFLTHLRRSACEDWDFRCLCLFVRGNEWVPAFPPPNWEGVGILPHPTMKNCTWRLSCTMFMSGFTMHWIPTGSFSPPDLEGISIFLHSVLSFLMSSLQCRLLHVQIPLSARRKVITLSLMLVPLSRAHRHFTWEMLQLSIPVRSENQSVQPPKTWLAYFL